MIPDLKNLFSIAGKTALVTGGSRGIGEMIAAGFLNQGAKVYISSRKADACDATAKRLRDIHGGECISLPADISNISGIEGLAGELAAKESSLDILINNAGAAWGAPLDEFPEIGWDKVMDTNVKSVFFLTQKLLPLLRKSASHENPARIVNVGSIDGIKARLPAIQQALPDGVTIKAFYDQADLVEKAVTTVTQALGQAFVLIVVVLVLFLLNLRASFLVLISIPLSVGLALMVMAWQGVSANLMSLGGLAIAIGMMVDGSVVMMENIFQHLSKPDESHRKYIEEVVAPGDSDPFDAIHDHHGIALRIEEAAREVGRPVFFAVGVVVVVFAPLFTLHQNTAVLIRQGLVST